MTCFVVAIAFLNVRAAPIEGIMDKIQTYMENDMRGCPADFQRKLKDTTFQEVRNPNNRCSQECAKDLMPFDLGSYSYSGSTVLCCCSKLAEKSEDTKPWAKQSMQLREEHFSQLETRNSDIHRWLFTRIDSTMIRPSFHWSSSQSFSSTHHQVKSVHSDGCIYMRLSCFSFLFASDQRL